MSRISHSKVKKSRSLQRARRHLRVRSKVVGTAGRPRLVVFRSIKNTEGQLVDDDARKTIVGLSTLAPELRDVTPPDGEHRRVAQARAAGKLLAERALKAGIQEIVFDRGGYRYHGRVKAFAEGARAGGLKF